MALAGWRLPEMGVFHAVAGAGRILSTAAASLVLDAASASAGVVEAATGRPRGRVLRVQVAIFSDDDGPLCQPEAVSPSLELAGRVFASVGIRLRHVGTQILPGPAKSTELDPQANRRLLLDDILGRTVGYRVAQAPGRRLGAPVTVVVVRQIAGTTTGCSLGISADWVICQASLFDAANQRGFDATVLAHELAHALNLPHCRDKRNLMYPISSPPTEIRGTALSDWQGMVLRANRHVIPASVR